jgi:hypothetical protein
MLLGAIAVPALEPVAVDIMRRVGQAGKRRSGEVLAIACEVKILGRSLASGLLASDDAAIDSEQLIVWAIADVEGPHLALLDLLVAWRLLTRALNVCDRKPPERLDIPADSYGTGHGAWRSGGGLLTKWNMIALALLLSCPGCLALYSGMVSRFLVPVIPER